MRIASSYPSNSEGRREARAPAAAIRHASGAASERALDLAVGLVLATAQVHSMLLVSRNTKDFPADEPGIRVPYKV